MYKFKLIVHKLGWDDIPADVAEEAIELMLTNHREYMEDKYGHSEDDKTVINIWIDSFTPVKEVFLNLVVDSEYSSRDTGFHELAWAMRKDIHDLMKGGMPFWEIQIEWDL
jgi:hypothetical protein